MMKVVIVDYSMGNLRSVYNKFRRQAVDCQITADATEIARADALVLPGVGHYGRAMDKLRQLGLLSVLRERVLEAKVPVIGICLGMQLLMEGSEEGQAEGLGWIKGDVIRFRIDETPMVKVPHIGWNSVRHTKQHAIVANLPDDSLFYFVHSYHARIANPSDVLHQTHYAYDFVSAVQKNNIFGFQYHPEKSQDVGVQLIQNFIRLTLPTYVPSPDYSVSALER